MKRKIISFFSAMVLCFTITACNSSEPASAPSVADDDKAAVQDNLNKTESKTDKSEETSNDTSAEAPTESMMTARIFLLPIFQEPMKTTMSALLR